MREVWLILAREFTVRTRTRGFLLATIIGLFAIVALNFAPSFFDAMLAGEKIKIGVSDENGSFYPLLKADLTDTLPNGTPRYELSHFQGGEEEATRAVKVGSLDALLLLRSPGDGGDEQYSFVLVSESVLPGDVSSRLAAAVSSAAAFLRLERLGVGKQEAASLFSRAEGEHRIVGEGPRSQVAASESWALTYVLVLLLYATVILYGTYLAMGVIQEKSTRVVEILLSTTRPFNLMLGKVLGLGAVALLQYVIWLATGFAMLFLGGSRERLELGPLNVEFSKVDPWLLVAFLVFFLLGFFSYAGLFAAGGSLVSRTEDAQQVTGPLSFILVVVFLVSLYALDSPDGRLAVAFSLTPLLSPIVMFVRVAVGQPPVWQIGVSIGLSVLAVLALIALAAKVFRTGVLLYGQGISLRALRRALR